MESLPILASYNKNFNLNNRPDLKSIYLEYQSDLLVNGYNDLKNIEYTYGKKEQIKNELSFKDKIKQSKLYRALALQKKVFLMLFKSSN
jgi:hypothetical protein